MKKVYIYISIIIFLLGVNFYVYYTKDSLHTTSFVDTHFSIKDTAALKTVIIAHQEDTIHLERLNDQWVLNEHYPTEQRFLSLLLSIIYRVRINRVVENHSYPTESTVNILTQKGRVLSFGIYRNATKTKSYFLEKTTAYEVNVPGYIDNVADIFYLHPDQWKNRLIINSNWRTIQSLHITYLNEKKNTLHIVFDKEFFVVNNIIENIDSMQVVDYLDQFQYFHANEMISPGRFHHLDSIQRVSKPMAILTIDDIYLETPKIINIYQKLSDRHFYLVTDESGKMMVVATNRIDKILKTPEDFF